MPLSLGLLNLTEEELNLVDLGTFLAPGSGTLVDFTGLYLPGEFRDSLSLYEQVVVSGTIAISGSEGLLNQSESLRFFAGAQFADQNFTTDGRDLRDINSRRNWKKSTTESTTTSTDWQRKMRLNMDITAPGTYRMAWTADISSATNNQEVASRVQLDDSPPNFDFNQSKGKDIVSVAGFHYSTLTSGSHTLDLDWKAVAGGTAKIEKARLEYWAESVETEEA